MQSEKELKTSGSGVAGDGNQLTEERDAKVNRLGTGKIVPLLLEFAIPAIVGMMVNALYNIISAIFLGQAMGTIGISAMQVAFPTTTVFIAIAMMIGSGGNALCALRLGEGSRDKAEHVLGNTVTLALIASVLVALVASIPAMLDAVLTLSSATDAVRPYAASFIRIISFGFVFQCIGFGVNNFIRTAGAPNRALTTMVIGAVVCIIANYLFVMVLGWGVEGSAAASLVGQGASCVSVLWYFTMTKNVPIRIHLHYMKPDGAVMRSILALGLASFATQIGNAILSLATNYLLVKYGGMSPLGEEAALASIGVVQRVALFSVMPLIGISVAAQPLLGFNYGAKLVGRVRATLFDAMLLAAAFGALMWFIAHTWPTQIINLFGITDSGLVEFTVWAMQVQVLVIPIVGPQIVGSNYFQATGQAKKSIILSLSRQVIFLLPLLFIFPEWLPTWTMLDPLQAIYVATPASDILAIVLTSVFVMIELKRLNDMEKKK